MCMPIQLGYKYRYLWLFIPCEISARVDFCLPPDCKLNHLLLYSTIHCNCTVLTLQGSLCSGHCEVFTMQWLLFSDHSAVVTVYLMCDKFFIINISTNLRIDRFSGIKKQSEIINFPFLWHIFLYCHAT